MIKNGFHEKQNLRMSAFGKQGFCLYETGLIHCRCGREQIVQYNFIFLFIYFPRNVQSTTEMTHRQKEMQNKVVGGYF